MTDISNSHTFRLFKQQSIGPFLGGMASIFDLADSKQFYNYDKSDAEADINSLRADWKQVGADLASAMRDYAPGQKA